MESGAFVNTITCSIKAQLHLEVISMDEGVINDLVNDTLTDGHFQVRSHPHSGAAGL